MKKILFFIGGLVSGGKERRFIELLTYLNSKKDFNILVVTTSKEIHFPGFKDLDIPLSSIIKNKYIKSLSLPFEIYKVVKEFQPDIIHTWGRMQNFYILPAKLVWKIPLINAQITNASPNIPFYNKILDRINFFFSDIILSNSYAGIDAYNPPQKKSSVIYNGMNIQRFCNLPPKDIIKKKYGIETTFSVVMVATFSKNKDYEMFFRVAKSVIKMRDDVSFIGVGYFHRDASIYKECKALIQNDPKLLMTGVIFDVEALVNSCDIGILFSNTKVHGEGISNAILEYMALKKPVIANDAGGTKEIVTNGVNGFLINKESIKDISNLISRLLDDPNKRENLGKNGLNLVHEKFTIQKMGESFVRLYNSIFHANNKQSNT